MVIRRAAQVVVLGRHPLGLGRWPRDQIAPVGQDVAQGATRVPFVALAVPPGAEFKGQRAGRLDALGAVAALGQAEQPQTTAVAVTSKCGSATFLNPRGGRATRGGVLGALTRNKFRAAPSVSPPLEGGGRRVSSACGALFRQSVADTILYKAADATALLTPATQLRWRIWAASRHRVF